MNYNLRTPSRLTELLRRVYPSVCLPPDYISRLKIIRERVKANSDLIINGKPEVGTLVKPTKRFSRGARTTLVKGVHAFGRSVPESFANCMHVLKGP